MADDEGGEVGAEVSEGVNEAHDRADGLCGQGFCGDGPERRHGAVSTDTAENDEDEGKKGGIGNHGHSQKNEDTAEGHGGRGVHAALASLVRVTRNDKQSDGADDEWKCVDDSGVQAAELLEIFRGAGQPEEQAHLAADKTEVDGGEHKNLRARQSAQVGNVFGAFQIAGFGAQGGDEGFAFGGRKPTRLGGVVLNEGEPDGQTDERKSALGHEHDAPAPVVQHPAGKRRRKNDGAGETEQPHGVGAGTFRAREPMGEKNQGGGKNAAFGHAEEQAENKQLAIGARKTATDSEPGPGDEQDADKFFGAPMLSERAAGNLEREIAPEENACNSAGLLGVEIEVAADARQGKGDVGAVDEGDGVHDQGDGDDAGPAGRGEVGGGGGGGGGWRGPGCGGGGA